MEYLIGLYIVGWVVCSLFVIVRVKENKYDFSKEKFLPVFGIGLFTCFVWPWFLGWIIREKFIKRSDY